MIMTPRTSSRDSSTNQICWFGDFARHLVAAGVVFLMSSTVQAESARTIRMKAQNGDIDAKASLYAAAAKGESEAQFELGNLIGGNESIFWIRKSAEQGYAPAQVLIGLDYELGRHDVKVDSSEAVKWYRKAAEQNYANGQYALGFMYERGLGVAKDNREAVRLYRLAAEQDDALGMANLGYAYADGSGVEKNDVEAAKWLKRAALKNISNAQGHLATKYLEGRGVPQDLTRACAWFAVAYANPNSSSDEKKQMLEYCNALEARFTEDQKREAIKIGHQLQSEISDQLKIDLSKVMAK